MDFLIVFYLIFRLTNNNNNNNMYIHTYIQYCYCISIYPKHTGVMGDRQRNLFQESLGFIFCGC
jgi:hypothetical protein